MNKNPQKKKAGLSREDILEAFKELSDELGRQNIEGELCLFGGGVMVLAFSARFSTKDVDAIFQPAQTIRSLAAEIGEKRGWLSTWLNDGVKGFVSSKHELTRGNLPQFTNLRLTMPTPEYLLAMKCMASRIDYASDEEGDVRDIRFLIGHLKLKNPKQVMDIVASYYPPDKIPVKAQYLVESLFEREEP